MIGRSITRSMGGQLNTCGRKPCASCYQVTGRNKSQLTTYLGIQCEITQCAAEIYFKNDQTFTSFLHIFQCSKTSSLNTSTPRHCNHHGRNRPGPEWPPPETVFQSHHDWYGFRHSQVSRFVNGENNTQCLLFQHVDFSGWFYRACNALRRICFFCVWIHLLRSLQHLLEC